MTKALRQTYQLRIDLEGAKPPIWRRLIVEDSIKLSTFHVAIQIAMGWTDSHMHQFIADNQFYGAPDPEFSFHEIRDETKFRLKQVLKKENDVIIYEYDFGDGWTHKIKLEKIFPFDAKAQLPYCVKAKGACPPEDIGGIWGYYHFLDVMKDPEHPEHEDYKEWIDGDFDPNEYDLDETNELLLEHCR